MEEGELKVEDEVVFGLRCGRLEFEMGGREFEWLTIIRV